MNNSLASRLNRASALCVALALAACSRPRVDDLLARDGSAMDATISEDAAPDSAVETGVDAAVIDAPDDVLRCGPDAGAAPRVCGDRCVDIATSRLHCGRCDRECAPDETCQAGSCVFTCAAGLVACRNRCVDPRTNPDYCGARDNCSGPNAGNQCTGGESCVMGACQFVCPAGQIACDGNCIAPDSNPLFCGASGACTGATRGAACPMGRVCVMGTCQCPTGFVNCGGTCVDPNTNRDFCGATGTCMGANAGRVCPIGQICIGGACGSTCGTGAVLCGGNCVDPQSNRAFCGARTDCAGPNAGQACTATELCIDGECRYFEPPQSYSSVLVDAPFAGERDAFRPIDTTVGAIRPATIYYTCDGSIPAPGMGTTRVATNVLITPVGATNCRQLRWFADYGAPFGRERVIHSRTVRVLNTDPNMITFGVLADAVRINSRGPVAVLRPGESFVLELNQQYWASGALGYCPGCILQSNLSMDSDNAQGFVSIACVSYGGIRYPGITLPRRVTLTAPTRPGRYALREQVTLNFGCNTGGGAYPGGGAFGYIIVN